MAAQGTFAEDLSVLGNPSSGLPQGSFRYGGPNGKRLCVRLGILTVLTGGGGALTTDFPASIFNLTSLVSCSQLIDSGNANIYDASVDYNQASVLTRVFGAQGVANIPAGTYRIKVEGYE